MKNKFDFEEITEYIENEPLESKIYIGVDSKTSKNKDGSWTAEFYSVICVHKSGRHGVHIFGQIERERDYIYNKKKPTYRLMVEVQKAAQTYLELAQAIGERGVEIHLDLNPDKRFASSAVIDYAVGYIKGMTGLTPKVKPYSFCASYGADHLGRC